MTRITQQGRTAGINADLQLAGSRLSKIQRQVASGRQIERPSDAPAVALEALRGAVERGRSQAVVISGESGAGKTVSVSPTRDPKVGTARGRSILLLERENGRAPRERRDAAGGL